MGLRRRRATGGRVPRRCGRLRDAGDCDCDGRVDLDDIFTLIREWGLSVPTTTADFDLDGDVDMDDLFTLLEHWG